MTTTVDGDERRGGDDVATGRSSLGERVVAVLRRYWPLLAASVVGLGVRLWHVLIARPACPGSGFAPGSGMPAPAPLDPPRCLALTGDSLFNYMQGQMVGEGKGYGNGFAYLDSATVVPSAGKPPLLATYLGILHRLGLQTVDQQRVGTAVLGAVGVLLIGLLAWRLAGRRAGTIAGALAAVSPLLWINDGRMMAEALYVPLVVGVLLAAYHFWARPRPATAAVLGVLIGLASLTRSESSQLVILLAVPLAAALPRLSLRGRVLLALVVASSALLVVTPWVLRNLATFEEPTLLQFGSGSVLMNGSCDSAYYDNASNLGLPDFTCFQGEAAPLLVELIRPRPGRDESVVDAEMRAIAVEYIGDNIDRVPAIVAYRQGRIWEVYRPLDNIEKNYRFEDRGKPESVGAAVAYYVTMPLAVVGLVVLRRRRIPIIPFVALPIVVSVAVASSFGVIRYRAGVDAAAIVLAGIALDAALRRWWRPLRSTEGVLSLRPPRRWFGLDAEGRRGTTPGPAPSTVAAEPPATAHR